jgi:hypothetical protein
VRFLVSCKEYREEVIGEPITIDQVPGETFAVHRTNIGAPSTMPYWTVTHVETGFAVSHGDTIDYAIRLARDSFATRDPEEIADRLGKARAMLAENKLKPIMQVPPEEYGDEDED